MKAIVLGGHVQGLGIVRALGRIGYEISVFDTTKKNIARHSKYCVEFKQISNEAILPFLLSEEGISKYSKSIIFPTNDEHVELLSKNLKKLQKIYRPAIDEWRVVSNCFDKKKTYNVAKCEQIKVPDTYFPLNLQEVEHISEIIKYPCIIKPAVMFRFYKQFKRKVFVCNQKKELVENYKKALGSISSEEIIIQDIIPGRSENQYSVGCLFNRNKPLVTIVARRRRQHPIDFGNATTYAETVNVPELKEISYRLLESINYQGICEVEFKMDPRDGYYKLLEINPRTWKWHSIAEKAKTPFLESYVRILNGSNPIENNEWEDASWSHYITDIPTILNMKYKRIYSPVSPKKRVHAVLSFDDLMPAIYEIMYLPYLIKNR